jgi:hypothetical protein
MEPTYPNLNSKDDKFPEMSKRDPSKEFNQLRPTSLRSSGSELDPCCEPGKQSTLRDTTIFTSESTNQKRVNVNGIRNPYPMLTEEGESLVSRTAPKSAFTLDRVGEKP